MHVWTLANPGRVVIDVAHSRLPRFPGIWDITSWHQYWAAQVAVENGHQPWLINPAMVVSAWASRRFASQPSIRQVGPNTFLVTDTGLDRVIIVTGTRPVPAGQVSPWVITSVVYAPR